jgi:transposase
MQSSRPVVPATESSQGTLSWRSTLLALSMSRLFDVHSVIVTAPDRVPAEPEALPERRLLDRCGGFRRSSSCPVDEPATKLVLRTLARRIEAATREAHELEREILGHVRALAPQPLDEPGVGPIVAAEVIVARSHPGRVRSEAAFARLAGVAPVPASSGQTIRHRLSRGGDRQLNRALHTIVLQRRQHDPATQRYIERRVAEGKSRRQATRPLKRHLARRLHRLPQHRPLMTRRAIGASFLSTGPRRGVLCLTTE